MDVCSNSKICMGNVDVVQQFSSYNKVTKRGFKEVCDVCILSLNVYFVVDIIIVLMQYQSFA